MNKKFKIKVKYTVKRSEDNADRLKADEKRNKIDDKKLMNRGWSMRKWRKWPILMECKKCRWEFRLSKMEDGLITNDKNEV